MDTKILKNKVFMLISILFCIILVGCSTSKRYYSTSVYNYLYSDKEAHTVTPSIPLLSLPLKVGIVFLPTIEGSLTENDKMSLMREVRDNFKKYKFVKNIDIIPSSYIMRNGGFSNLDQLSLMYGIDSIVLLSYDQSQFTDQGFSSISYWTLVGAYVVKGEKNQTHTMIDAAVYDIKSRKMLFRAAGVSDIKGSSTPIKASKELRNDSLKGFKEASSEVIKNLENQLELFRKKIKEQPLEYKVIHKPGYKGSETP